MPLQAPLTLTLCPSRSEAQLLFAEARRCPDVSMPMLSESISRAILRVSDAAASQFESFGPEQKGRLWPLTREHVRCCTNAYSA